MLHSHCHLLSCAYIAMFISYAITTDNDFGICDHKQNTLPYFRNEFHIFMIK